MGRPSGNGVLNCFVMPTNEQPAAIQPSSHLTSLFFGTDESFETLKSILIVCRAAINEDGDKVLNGSVDWLLHISEVMLEDIRENFAKFPKRQALAS